MSKRAIAAIIIGLGILELSGHYAWDWLRELLRAAGSIGFGWVIVWATQLFWPKDRPVKGTGRIAE
jgi:hypothetical protein